MERLTEAGFDIRTGLNQDRIPALKPSDQPAHGLRREAGNLFMGRRRRFVKPLLIVGHGDASP